MWITTLRPNEALHGTERSIDEARVYPQVLSEKNSCTMTKPHSVGHTLEVLLTKGRSFDSLLFFGLIIERTNLKNRLAQLARFMEELPVVEFNRSIISFFILDSPIHKQNRVSEFSDFFQAFLGLRQLAFVLLREPCVVLLIPSTISHAVQNLEESVRISLVLSCSFRIKTIGVSLDAVHLT